MTATAWVVDEKQLSLIRQIFDLKIHDPIDITLEDIDQDSSLAIGQNRTEMALDEETVDIMTMYAEDGITFEMPLVFKQSVKSRKVIVLDGNHRIHMALNRRGEASVPAVLVTGDTQVAQRLAAIVNLQHGRSTRTADYVATTMRLLREQGLALPTIARMFGFSEARVGVMTRRDAQLERVRGLLPERRGRVPAHTLDLLGQVEDDHVKILGDVFLDAPKSQQDEFVRRLRDTPSAARDAAAHEIVGELREIERTKRKVKPITTKPAGQLQGALQRLVGVTDPTSAYYASTDQQKAIMRSNIATVLPRLERLWATIHGRDEEVA